MLVTGGVVGAGLKLHEDAHIHYVTGHGWDAATPWTIFFPTLEHWNSLLYNDHAVRGALEGLSVGAAAMLWSWRRTAAWVVGLAGPLLMFWGHVKWNYFAGHPGEILGGAPFPYGILLDVLDGGRIPVLVLIVGTFTAVAAELLILRWVGQRDRMFPPLPFGRFVSLLKGWNTQAGLSQLLARSDTSLYAAPSTTPAGERSALMRSLSSLTRTTPS
jgi:hypothetical protein